jgi:hypothetical protein
MAYPSFHAAGGTSGGWYQGLKDYIDAGDGAGGGYPASALVAFVDYANGLDTNNGFSPSTAFKTIQAAYNALKTYAEANYTAYAGLLPVGTVVCLPGDHDVGAGVTLSGTRPAKFCGWTHGMGHVHAPNSESRIVTSSNTATSMFAITETTVNGYGCEFRDLAFQVGSSGNAGLVGTALGVIYTNRQDYLKVVDCMADVSDGTTHISTPFIHQATSGTDPDSAWASIIGNTVGRLALARFASGGVNFNYIDIQRNRVFYGGSLAMVHASGDLQKSNISHNTFEGTSKAVLLASGACDFNTFVGNVGESADGANPFYHLSASCQGNIFAGGACNTADSSVGTWVQFDTNAHSNIVIVYGDGVSGTAGFKQKVVDNSTLGNMLHTPWRFSSGASSSQYGIYFGEATTQKLGWWGTTPAVQQVLATGAGKTVDNVITFLQSLGMCRQS